MTTSLLVFGIIAAYFVVGFLFMLTQKTQIVRRAHHEWDCLGLSAVSDSVFAQQVCRVMLWPILLPFDVVRAVWRRVGLRVALPPGYLQILYASIDLGLGLNRDQAIAIEDHLNQHGWEIVARWQVDESKRHVGPLPEPEAAG